MKLSQTVNTWSIIWLVAILTIYASGYFAGFFYSIEGLIQTSDVTGTIVLLTLAAATATVGMVVANALKKRVKKIEHMDNTVIVFIAVVVSAAIQFPLMNYLNQVLGG